MSETETAPASQTEEAPEKAVVFEYGESAPPESQEAAAPVETSDEAPETVTPEKDETASETAEQPAESKLEKAEKALARTNFENRQLKREAKEREATEKRAENQSQSPTQKQDTGEKPKRPDRYDPIFEGDDAKYDAALDEYEDGKIDRAIGKDRQARDQDRQAKTTQDRLNSFWDKSDALAEKDAEYAELVEANADIQMSDILRTTMMESDKGAELHNHIMRNSDDLLKINSLSIQYPSAAKREISRIVNTFGKESKGQPQPKQTSTKAPDPIPTVSGSSAPVAVSGIPEGMVFED